jgi:hypothetical protein
MISVNVEPFLFSVQRSVLCAAPGDLCGSNSLAFSLEET